MKIVLSKKECDTLKATMDSPGLQVGIGWEDSYAKKMFERQVQEDLNYSRWAAQW